MLTQASFLKGPVMDQGSHLSSLYWLESSSESGSLEGSMALEGVIKRDPGVPVYRGKSSTLFSVDDTGLIMPIDDQPFWHPVLERVLDYKCWRFFDPESGKPVQLDASVAIVHPLTKAKLYSAEAVFGI